MLGIKLQIFGVLDAFLTTEFIFCLFVSLWREMQSWKTNFWNVGNLSSKMATSNETSSVWVCVHIFILLGTNSFLSEVWSCHSSGNWRSEALVDFWVSEHVNGFGSVSPINGGYLSWLGPPAKNSLLCFSPWLWKASSFKSQSPWLVFLARTAGNAVRVCPAPNVWIMSFDWCCHLSNLSTHYCDRKIALWHFCNFFGTSKYKTFGTCCLR